MTIAELMTLLQNKKAPVSVVFTTRNTPDNLSPDDLYGHVDYGVGPHRYQEVFRSEEKLLETLGGIK